MLNYTKLLFLAGILTACGTLKNQSTLPDEFQAQLEQLFPDAVITKMDIEGHFEQSYQVELNQLLDHNDPDAGTFKQYVYLSHFSATAPTVLVTEGYAAYPGKYELSEYLEANQVMVEYRFYGKSKPDSIPWEYLTNDQAIEDYHTLVAKLKTLYPGKWLSTGISKGGETVLIYESKYPEDIDVAVPYVAPLIDTREDPRTDEHINSVGTAKCRTKIIRFQRSILENREAVLKEVKKYADEKKMTFKEVSVEEALEYAVLEFPFSFWQWGGTCADIPGDSATPLEKFNYINKIVGIHFYNDATYERMLPSYYQHSRLPASPPCTFFLAGE
ncbi:MAG: hypothetical protein JKY09_08605, partial [Crocinitomicaceae bacterium]|nr:hypothetical protein [Crocinitomicaceae bacterium]